MLNEDKYDDAAFTTTERPRLMGNVKTQAVDKAHKGIWTAWFRNFNEMIIKRLAPKHLLVDQ
ncbi:hypothetical protein N7494_006964 [Penicillium frequentans]|uniref:Uncharacterized protein n=1 Tax=Penicillium frequentans TaxID=3151616 RepID=A0AAD6CRM3_9EURO|nr:hypothetical protein N7494_006964 [Penicillium glabrum]